MGIGLTLRLCTCDTCGHKENTKTGTQCRKCWEGVLVEPLKRYVFNFTQRETKEQMEVIVLCPDTGENKRMELMAWCRHRNIKLDQKEDITYYKLESMFRRIA